VKQETAETSFNGKYRWGKKKVSDQGRDPSSREKEACSDSQKKIVDETESLVAGELQRENSTGGNLVTCYLGKKR